MSKLILFDISSNDGNICWSPYSWKLHLAFNYKGIEYETKFLEYPDIAPILETFGVPPATDLSQTHGAYYTIPAVRFPEGTYMMDSEIIVPQLEAMSGTDDKNLRFDSRSTERALDLTHQFDVNFYPNFMEKINGVLNDRSRDYFERTRSEAFGMSMAELEEKKGGEAPWIASESALNGMVDALSENEDGPFLLGEEPCYGDFVIVAFFQFIRRVDARQWERLMTYNEKLKVLYHACEKWIAPSMRKQVGSLS